MASRDLNMCVPELKDKMEQFIEKAKIVDLEFIITCTARNRTEQQALWMQGRYPLEVVNSMRKGAGLPGITSQENKRCVTWTLQSKHIVDDKAPLSRACDICLKVDGKASWDIKIDVNENRMPDFEELGMIGKGCGLKWGGDFKNRDMPHFEV